MYVISLIDLSDNMYLDKLIAKYTLYNHHGSNGIWFKTKKQKTICHDEKLIAFSSFHKSMNREKKRSENIYFTIYLYCTNEHKTKKWKSFGLIYCDRCCWRAK